MRRLTTLVVVLCASVSQAVVIETVPVGNPGNEPDTKVMVTDGTSGYGSVNYWYRMGKYEVTAGQYTEFLNAVAADDMYGLYTTDMWPSDLSCKIERSGSPGSYTYSVRPDRANRPVNCVSWGNAVRFANWLHNGQPTTGVQDVTTTEDGAYFLNGAMTREEILAVTREPDWVWAIPSEDEWYKAAYYDPNLNNGVGGYWDYPTKSDDPDVPSNDLVEPTDLGNNATFWDDGYTIGSPYWRTEVGAHENSDSAYGTFDQGGNVSEYNEAILPTIDGGTRGIRGGMFHQLCNSLHASYRGGGGGLEGSGNIYVGFRVARIPEPNTFTLTTLALLGLLCWRRNRR